MAGFAAPKNKTLVPTGVPLGPHRNLVEAELVASVGYWIRIRWIAGAGVILATWVVSLIFNLGVPQGPLSIIGAGILAYNLAFYLRERKLRAVAAPAADYISLAKWQVGMDWLAMILLIHFSGGIESPAIMFFFLHIIIVATFFPPRTAFAFTLLAIALVAIVALLEFSGVLPHVSITGLLDTPLYQNGLYVVSVLFFFSSTGLMAAYLTSSIHERLRQREEDVVLLTESLQDTTIRLQVLNEGARLVGSTLDLPQVLDRIVNSTAQAMGVRACSIRLIDPTGSRLEPVAVHGLSETYLNKGPIEIDTNPLARQVLSGKIVNIPDAHSSPLLQYPEEARQEGIRSMLSAPLVGKSGPMGILRLYAVEPDRFSPEDETFLAAIAAQGSIAIDNALAYRAIESLDAEKSQFVRRVTHDLRSPVSVTRSLLRNITAGYAGQVTEQQLDILNRASHRVDFLQKLIDDLLDLAAAKSEIKSHEVFEPISLESAVSLVVERFRVPAEDKNITLVWQNEAAGKPSDVMATPDGLDRLLNNLVSNAVKYTPNGGRVSITLSRVDGEIQVAVEDTGIGIPDEAMQHLFEEFYRAPNAKEIEREGTGLGLTIVKDLTTRFNGRVAVHSKPQEGTRFTVSLPVLEPVPG